MEKTAIRWTSSTWNPMVGCSKISQGCKNCYALEVTKRWPGNFPKGFAPDYKPERLILPQQWKVPRRIFVNSMSDLHHDAFTFEEVASVYDVMRAVERHTYQVLTKRPDRMAAFVEKWLRERGLAAVPPQIWLGTSIERDDFTHRADTLRTIPVPVRFISAEPLLGPLPSLDLTGLHWIIVGGESGQNFRPMDHAWARDLRDRCVAAGVAYFFKQSAAIRTEMGMDLDGRRWEQYPDDGRGEQHGQAARGDVQETPAPSLFTP